jgi:hypothetical protein
MSKAKGTIPGARPLEQYDWRPARSKGPKTIEDRRQSVINAIDRSLRGTKGAPRLEQVGSDGTPMIRVMYAGQPLPVFDGKPYAAISRDCDRAELWRAVKDEIRSGAVDGAIDDIARRVSLALERKRATMLQAV